MYEVYEVFMTQGTRFVSMRVIFKNIGFNVSFMHLNYIEKYSNSNFYVIAFKNTKL